MSERYVEAAGGEAELVTLDGAGHFEPIDPHRPPGPRSPPRWSACSVLARQQLRRADRVAAEQRRAGLFRQFGRGACASDRQRRSLRERREVCDHVVEPLGRGRRDDYTVGPELPRFLQERPRPGCPGRGR